MTRRKNHIGPLPHYAGHGRVDSERRRGRGAQSNVAGRFESQAAEDFDDGWESFSELTPFKTQVISERARRIITTNDSPDIPFDQSVNAYRGCEHGCIYCYARPSHCFLGYSAGLDFETRLIVETNALELLEREIASRGYEPRTIMLGSNTDPYQPIEREHRLTRGVLEICDRASHPVAIVTKSALVLRDLDLIASLASRGLIRVAISVTTLDHRLSRRMEPRASAPGKRLEALARLAEAGAPAGVMAAPLIPAINDMELERILSAAAEAGAKSAGYALLRLPLEVDPLFQEWLEAEFPDRAQRVMSLLRSARGGKDYVSRFGERMTGSGPYAEQIALRFELAVKRLKLGECAGRLRTDLFRRPVPPGGQFELFP
jgi:DNA repair photolyase